MDWIKIVSATIALMITIVTSCFACCSWINGKFEHVNDKFSEFNDRLTSIEKEMAVMKTVMFMNGHFPKELAANEGK